MRYALILALAAMFIGCEASAPGNSGQGSSPYVDTQSTTDAGSGSDSSAQPADDVAHNDTTSEPIGACVDLSVNEYIYDCQDGNPETPIIAYPEDCRYGAEMWSSKASNTQVLNGATRVIAKFGTNIADCLVKRKK